VCVEVGALDDAGVFVWDNDFGGYVEPGAGLDFEMLRVEKGQSRMALT
jgi:hypothetical protein